jgi:LmbE family N-acetylglucosaminyl deacetylase
MGNEFYVPQRAMVIVAHPDDIEFGSVGTITRWTKHGAQVCYVMCTSGDAGIADANMSREQVATIREAEQNEAARIAGVQEVVYLHEVDGMVENTMALRKKLVREIRRFKPDVVLTMDPTVVFVNDGWINHPDHRAVGMAAVDAVFPACSQPHVFPELEEEGLQAHRIKRLYMTSWDKANVYVNIEETMDIKIAALMAHKSQMEEMGGQNANFKPETMVREWAAERGKGKEMAYAEAFRVIVMRED